MFTPPYRSFGAPTFHIVILKADRFLAEALGQVLAGEIVGAKIRIVSRVREAAEIVAVHPVDLLISGIGLMDGDIFEFLAMASAATSGVRRILVVTGRKEERILSGLRKLAVPGVFDSAAEGMGQFRLAVAAVLGGTAYWSPSVLECLYQMSVGPNSICRKLTPAEQRVLSVVGDGSDDREAAVRLGLQPSTVHSVRRELHRKLGVRHRGDLIRLAVLLGFVRLSNGAVEHPRSALLRGVAMPPSSVRLEKSGQ